MCSNARVTLDIIKLAVLTLCAFRKASVSIDLIRTTGVRDRRALAKVPPQNCDEPAVTPTTSFAFTFCFVYDLT